MRSCTTKQEDLEQLFGVSQCVCLVGGRKLARVPGSFNLLFPPYLRSKQVCAHSSGLEFWFSTALLLVLLVFKPAKGLVFPVSYSRAGVPNVWFELLTLQGGSLCPCNHSPLLGPLLGVQAPNPSLHFPSYLTLCVSFLQPWLYKSLPASLRFVFSENCSTCRCIFGVFGGGGAQCPSTLPS